MKKQNCAALLLAACLQAPVSNAWSFDPANAPADLSPPLMNDSSHRGTPAALAVHQFTAARHRDEAGAGDAVRFTTFGETLGTRLAFGAALTDDEHRFDIGFEHGALAFTLFDGRGEGYSRLDESGFAMDPDFFHGGSTQRFDYRGAAVDVAIQRSVSLQFGHARIDAEGVDTRKTAYAGVAAGAAAGGVFSVSRSDETVANGVLLSYAGSRWGARWHQIDHDSGARHRAASLSWSGDKGRWYSVSIESGRNPLFREGEEDRIMFRVAGTLGPTPLRLNADDAVENGDYTIPEDPPSGRGRAIGVLAGALVVAGIASSSGDGSKDEAVRISGRDKTARQILNRINPVSVRQNREYGGWIYRNGDGTYGYTAPIAGTPSSVDIGPKSSIPGGTTASASYHTHAAADPRYNNEDFSPSDLLTDRLQRVDGYLGTPAGQFKLHDFRTGRITVLGTIAN